MTPAGSNTYLVENDVRFWLRDNDPESNILLDDFEFSPEEIRQAMTYCVDFWNDQPPYIRNYDYDDFPYRFQLLQGTSANLLTMAGHRFRRNALNAQGGGLSMDDQAKCQQYDAAAARLWEGYSTWVTMNKRSLNAEQGFAPIG